MPTVTCKLMTVGIPQLGDVAASPPSYSKVPTALQLQSSTARQTISSNTGHVFSSGGVTIRPSVPALPVPALE
jgi:hypothetical protein